FRGLNPAFVTATEALSFWEDDRLSRSVASKGARVSAVLEALRTAYPELEATERGRGLIHGLACADAGGVEAVVTAAFERGLILETSGCESNVLKVLPALNIDEGHLERGLLILDEAIAAALHVERRLAPGDVWEVVA
ncbi:MAG: aminotransferase class III-fold pyridoxal phosphate-dependent enzyme, partial [Acidimicrobiales bacterium]|nr:aminotransferase class III-fold pyridoxal phosphate-dependent enzyme [Acidimicrobiales bacterium]